MAETEVRRKQKATYAAAHRKRMLGEGKRQYAYWLTDDEKSRVDDLIKCLRC